MFDWIRKIISSKKPVPKKSTNISAKRWQYDKTGMKKIPFKE